MMFLNEPADDEFLILSMSIHRSNPYARGCAYLRNHYSRLCAARGWPLIVAYPKKGGSDRQLWEVELDLMTMFNPISIMLSDRARRDIEERMMIYSKPTKYAQKLYAKWNIALWVTAGFYSHCSYIDQQHVFRLCCEIRDIVKNGVVSNEIAEKLGEKSE